MSNQQSALSSLLFYELAVISGFSAVSSLSEGRNPSSLISLSQHACYFPKDSRFWEQTKPVLPKQRSLSLLYIYFTFFFFYLSISHGVWMSRTSLAYMSESGNDPTCLQLPHCIQKCWNQRVLLLAPLPDLLPLRERERASERASASPRFLLPVFEKARKDISLCLLLGETVQEGTQNRFHFQPIHMQEIHAQMTSRKHAPD